MKNWLIIAVVCIIIQPLAAQPMQEASTLTAATIRIPDTATYSVAAIAEYVKGHCTAEADKIHTLFDWVVTHLKYDTDSMYYFNWSKDRATVATTTLHRRKGVCENYAALFTELLVQSGISAWVVNGYTNTSRTGDFSGHSWAAVKLGNDWWLCDPTWEAGGGKSNQWLMVHPDDFLKTHMPFDPLWQLQYYPITHKTFQQGGRMEKGDYFNYADSVQQFLALDSLRQMEAFAHRMVNTGLDNNRLRIWHSYNQMRIAIIYGDRDRELYNTAVDLLNEAVKVFNNYTQYRNQQFTPFRSDAAIAGLLQPIESLINQAELQLGQMGLVVENVQYDTGAIKERLQKLTDKVRTQQGFINQYLATAPNKREQLFLK